MDALLEFNNSGVAFAVSPLVADKDRVILGNDIGSANFSGRACAANNTHWTFDTAMLARAVGTAVVHEGREDWFFIRVDYAFGKALTDDTSAIVEKKGGKVVALALAGGDLMNRLKQANEFNIGGGGQKVVCLIIYLNNIHSLGLKAAKGAELAESF